MATTAREGENESVRKMAGRGGVHSASSPSCVSRSLDRTLSDAQDTCELKLSGRKLKDYPKAAVKYNLSDTVLAGKTWRQDIVRSCCLPLPTCTFLSNTRHTHTHTYTHLGICAQGLNTRTHKLISQRCVRLVLEREI